MSKPTDRDLIIMRLRSTWGLKTNSELMLALRQAGKVSDNAITINEVADCDLVRAYNQTFEEGRK